MYAFSVGAVSPKKELLYTLVLRTVFREKYKLFAIRPRQDMILDESARVLLKPSSHLPKENAVCRARANMAFKTLCRRLINPQNKLMRVYVSPERAIEQMSCATHHSARFEAFPPRIFHRKERPKRRCVGLRKEAWRRHGRHHQFCLCCEKRQREQSLSNIPPTGVVIMYL